MLTFWLFAAVMVALALTALLPSLLGLRLPRSDGDDRSAEIAVYRQRLAELDQRLGAGEVDADEHAATRTELEREMLSDLDGRGPVAERTVNPLPAVLVAFAVPMVAFGIYLQLGAFDSLRDGVGTPSQIPVRAAAPAAPAPSAPGGAPAAQLPHGVEDMVARLRERLTANPDDVEGWVMLGRSYATMNRLPDAREALLEADRRAPNEPLTLVALAEVVAGINGNRLEGEATALIDRALAIAPEFPRARWLAGLAAFQRQDREAAARHWEVILRVPGLEAADAQRVRDAIARARGAPPAVAAGAPAARPTAAPLAAAGSPPSAAAASAAVAVSVSVDPALAARASPGDTVFVFARAADGPRMPLAIVRRTVADLPFTVTLDDTMAMMPQMRLSAFPEVVVGARISASGSATPTPGDLEGASPALATATTKRVDVRIDRVVE
ncbi:MAG: c-type cytochrome biogenesis protein CcmI [Ectothiorhodospiraceae bacterium]|nr:c-type cytochrome biogenesis protein CcmI [Ectothiorhodospiraceae bacterium]